MKFQDSYFKVLKLKLITQNFLAPVSLRKFSNTASDGRRIVDISKDIDEDVLRSLIDYMYQGYLEIPPENTSERQKVFIFF